MPKGTPRRVNRSGPARYQPLPQPVVYANGPNFRRSTQAPQWRYGQLLGYFLATTVAVGLFSMVPRALEAMQGAHLETIVSGVTMKVINTTPKVDTVKVQSNAQAIIAANPKLKIGVSIVDLPTGEKVNIGSQSAFTGASTTKVLTAAAYLKTVEDGKNSLNKVIAGYPAKWHIQQMLNQSNNHSWELLIAEVGRTKLQSYARANGMPGYSVKNNSLTPADDANLLAKLADGKLLNQSHTQLVLSYMHTTNNEDMMPAAVPTSATVRHKYGQLEEYLHDTAIITNKGRTYAISIYTSGADGNDYAARTKTIRAITRSIVTDMPAGRAL